MVNGAPSDWTFIGYDNPLAHLPQHRWFQDLINGRRVALRSNDVFAQCSAAVAGIGITMAPCLLAREHRELVQIEDQRPRIAPVAAGSSCLAAISGDRCGEATADGHFRRYAGLRK